MTQCPFHGHRRRSLGERLASAGWCLVEWWERHVTQRRLHRLLDRARLDTGPYTEDDITESQRRIE